MIVDLINPDSVILLGDRYEIAQIALLTHIKKYTYNSPTWGRKLLVQKMIIIDIVYQN